MNKTRDTAGLRRIGHLVFAIGLAALLVSCGGGDGGGSPPGNGPSPVALSLLPNLGTGAGAVTCSKGGAAFAACESSYPGGTQLALRATPNAGSSFAGWLDASASAAICGGTAGDCAITLSVDSAVRANFSLLPVSSGAVQVISATGNGGGGTVQCRADAGAAGPCGSHPVGATMLLTATPDANSVFTGWSGGTRTAAACNGSAGTCTFTLAGDTTVTATFNRPTLTVNVVGSGSVNSSPAGIANCTVSCTAPFNRGSSIVLTPAAGLSGWSGGGCTGNAGCSVSLNANTTVNATFGGAGLPPFAQQAYLKASNAEAGDGALMSVALSGDTLAVGMPNESSAATGVNGNQADNSALGSGAVYVFTRSAGAWSQQAYLKASNTEGADQFGLVVALDGDTLAVGTGSEDSNATGVNGNQADNSASGSGAVYVFTRVGASWSQQAYIKASNTGTDDDFGRSLALSGETLVVGARGEASNAIGVNGNQANNSATLSGAAYVFTRANGIWTQQAYLKASNADAGDLFGESVAVSGDTIAVGARFESGGATGVNGNQADNSMPRSGAVYVFVRANGVWSQQAYVKASNTEMGDEFGLGLALSGDTLAVAARLESSNARGVNGNQADNSAAGSGAVYVFTRSGSNWSQQAYLKASNGEAGDTFGGEGHGVALSGDTLLVGAMREDSSATGVNGNQGDNGNSGSGAAYVFKRVGGVWSQQAYLKASNTGTGDLFGSAVTLSGDTLVVAAPWEASNARGVNGDQSDNSAVQSGAAYVFVAQ